MRVKDLLATVNQLKQQNPIYDYNEAQLVFDAEYNGVTSGVDEQGNLVIHFTTVEKPEVETEDDLIADVEVVEEEVA
jgi:hypothetical protein